MVIDTNAPEFQVGRRLYDAQVIFADCERFMASKGPLPSAQRIMELAKWYCELVSEAGQLRVEYADLLRSVGGIYHEVLVLEKDLEKMMGMNGEGTTGGQDA